MAHRLDEKTITQGTVDNRVKGRVVFELHFCDGQVVRGDLAGNPERDMAGCLLTLENPKARLADDDIAPSRLAEKQTGDCGDITAARKVKVFRSGKFLKKGPVSAEDIEWKNSLYLEWYSPENGRVVLEAVDFEMTLGEAAWEMTAEEELSAEEDAGMAFLNFLDLQSDLEREREIDRQAAAGKESMDEFAWEKSMRFSDRMSERFGEALDKFGDDEEAVRKAMGWASREKAESEVSESAVEFGEPWNIEDEDIWAAEKHPLAVKAKEIEEDYRTRFEAGEAWVLLATVGAKLAGALSGYGVDGHFDDHGFAIACLKRVLGHIDLAYAGNKDEKTRKWLLELRQGVIDLQQKLRAEE